MTEAGWQTATPCRTQAATPTPAHDGKHHCPARKRTRLNQPLDQAALDLASVSARCRSLGGKMAGVYRNC